jgi:signal transduction histidine kinase/CheY-like chemotaxis protein
MAPDGSLTGFYVEVLREAARREGLGLDLRLRPDGPDRALGAGEVDIWPAVVRTPERAKRWHFTAPWWAQDHYLAVAKAGPVFGEGDLAGRTVLRGTTPPFTRRLEEEFPGARFVALADVRTRLRMLCEGRADAVLFYQETGLFAFTGSGEMDGCRERGLRILPVTKPIMEVSMAARPERAMAAERLRKRIEEMRRDGTLARLAASPMTGTESFQRLLREGEGEHRQRMMEMGLLFTGLLLAGVGTAYWRLRRANRRAEAALAAAERASKAKSDFLAMMSHEIRTPLTAVLGYTELLAGTPLRHDQRRFAGEITQATEALLTVISTILGYAHPSRTAPPPENEQVDAPGIVDDCVAAVQLAAEDKGLCLHVEVDPGVPRRLEGPAAGLRQALLNLLNNAVKFTPAGWVRLRVRYDKDMLTCVVSDSGPGIPTEQRRTVFEAFTQLDSPDNRRQGGVGLGLAVVAEISRKLGGDIRVDDAPGGGARFVLRLPYREVAGAGGWLGAPVTGTAAVLAAPGETVDTLLLYLRSAGMEARLCLDPGETAAADLVFVDGAHFALAPAGRSRRILIGPLRFLRRVPEDTVRQVDDVLPLPATCRALREILHPPSARVEAMPVRVARRVLVVDDNAVNRRVLTSLLEKLECRVDTAANGQEAVEAAENENYTVIFMDCQMPVMNGYEAAEEIRRRALGRAAAPICGISASLDHETRVRCEAAGMEEYLPKPVTMDALRDVLTRVSARQIIAENLQFPA